MSQQENRGADSHVSDWGETSARLDDCGIFPRGRAMEEAGTSIARVLNGPLTALLIYMGELKQHSHRLCEKPEEREHLQKVLENALQQTERVCALVRQVGGIQAGAIVPPTQGCLEHAREDHAAVLTTPPSEGARQPLTRREREVLNLISEGCSNKQGALRMHISPRTFESHRAEAMRKLGARNTADLVRAALLHAID